MGCCHAGSVNVEEDEEIIRTAFIDAEVTYFSGFIVYSRIKSRDYIKSDSLCEDFISSIIYQEADKSRQFEVQKEYLRLMINARSSYRPIHDADALGVNAAQIQDFKFLGLFCVFHAGFNTPKQRKSLLVKHVMDCYGRTNDSMRNFLYDLIELNTTLILKSFKFKLQHYETYVKSIWTDENKKRLLDELMGLCREVARIEEDTRNHENSRRKSSHLTYLNNLEDTSIMNSSKNESFLKIKNRFHEEINPNFDFICEKFIFDHFPLLNGASIRRRLLQIYDQRS